MQTCCHTSVSIIKLHMQGVGQEHDYNKDCLASALLTEVYSNLSFSLSFSYCSDYEAWMELCDLYIREQDYSKACFCMEELIMSNPHNHLFHQRYAEVRTHRTVIDMTSIDRSK